MAARCRYDPGPAIDECRLTESREARAAGPDTLDEGMRPVNDRGCITNADRADRDVRIEHREQGFEITGACCREKCVNDLTSTLEIRIGPHRRSLHSSSRTTR